ncbi:MAG: adenylate kinase family protein [Pyrobaculum sp.]
MTYGVRGPKVLITGTPGVGKTTQCALLAKSLSTNCISLGELLSASPFVKYDPDLDTYEIIDLEKAREVVASHIRGGEVVDTHVVALVPDPEAVIVLRKAPDVLFEELKSRGWPLRKVVDNVWAEILDVVYLEAAERWRRVWQIDVTKREAWETHLLVKTCVVQGRCVFEEVDWLSYAEETGFLAFIERLSRETES